MNKFEIETLIKESEEITKLEKTRNAKPAYIEYKTKLVQKRGYIDLNDYYHKTRGTKSMQENKHCPQYLGVYVAERVLSKVFDKVQRMPFENKGYDFICKNDFKVDVKSACLYHSNNNWNFYINNNKIANYFLLLAFDNRVDLNPLHIWLIKSNEIIINEHGSTILNEKKALSISNSTYSRSNYIQYEQTDKLGKLIKCCDIFKGDNHESK